jgi:hypothetical protein
VAVFFVGIFYLFRSISKDISRRKEKKVPPAYRVKRRVLKKGGYSNDHAYVSDLTHNNHIQDASHGSSHDSDHSYHDFLGHISDISHGIDSLDIDHH